MGFVTDLFGGGAAQDAAAALEEGYNQSIGTFEGAERRARSDQRPYSTLGANAANTLNRSFFGGDGPDYSAFEADPGYQFRLSEGQKSQRLPGMTLSGAQRKGLSRYNQGFASNEFGNWYNRMRDLTGVGQGAANTLTGVGMTTAGRVGSAQEGAANARASGYQAKANIYGGLADTGLNLLSGGISSRFGRGGGGENIYGGGYGNDPNKYGGYA